MTLRVAITGVSGLVGSGAIKGLRAGDAGTEDIWILGLDASDDCAARHLVDAYVQLPRISDSKYIDKLVETLRAYRIEVLLPGIHAEVLILSRSRERLSQVCAHVAIAPSELVEVANDKLTTASYLVARGIAVPPTWDADCAEDVGLPLIAKPRRGHGSRGVFFLKDAADLHAFSIKRYKGYCLQRFIDGPEITIGFLYDANGMLRDALAMERTLEGGRSIRGKVVTCPDVVRFIEDFGTRVSAIGAINAQIRMDVALGPLVFEINARLSGSTDMRVAVGFNDPIRLVLHLARGIPIERAAVRPATVYRYSTELVVTP